MSVVSLCARPCAGCWVAYFCSREARMLLDEGGAFIYCCPTETLNLEIGEKPPWSVLPNLFESLKTLIKAFKVWNETSLGTWYAVMFWEQHLTFFFLIYLRDKWLGGGTRGNYFIILQSVSHIIYPNIYWLLILIFSRSYFLYTIYNKKFQTYTKVKLI